MVIQHIASGAEESKTPESSGCDSESNASETVHGTRKNGIRHVEYVPRDPSTPDPSTPDQSTSGHNTPESHTKPNGSGYQPRYPRRADRINQAITAKNAQCFFDHSCSIFVGNLSTKIVPARMEEDLVKTFSEFGQCWVKVKEGRQKALPGAFVVFDNPESAQKAIEQYPGIQLHDRTLRVEPAACKRDAIIGHHSGQPITEYDIAYALNSWGSIENVIIEQSLNSGEPLQVGRVTFAFLGDYEEAVKDYSDETFYLHPAMDSQRSPGNQAGRANNQMAPRGNGQRFNNNHNNRPRGGRQFPPRGGNARSNYGGSNRYSNGYGNHQSMNGPTSPNGYNGQGFANNNAPAGFPINNFPNNHFPGHGYSNSSGFHQNHPNNFQGYPNQGFPAPGPFPAAQPMMFNPQMQFQEGPPAPYYTAEPFPPVYPFIVPNQPGYLPQPPLPQHMPQQMHMANVGPGPGSYLPPIPTGPLIVSSQPMNDIQPNQHSPPYYPDPYMADNGYTGMQNDWHSPSTGYGLQEGYTHNQPINNLPGLHRETASSCRSSRNSTAPSSPKEKGCERPKRQGLTIDSETPRLIPVRHADTDGSSDLLPTQPDYSESGIVTATPSEPLGDAKKEDDTQTAVSEPVLSSRNTVEAPAQDKEENPDDETPNDETKQLLAAPPSVEQVADRKGKGVLRSITPKHESKLIPTIPLHAKRAAYGEGKAASLESPTKTGSFNSTPTKTPAKPKASASTTTNTPTKSPIKAESSASAAPKTPAPTESKKAVAPETPATVEPQRTIPRYSATASSWRSAAPASVKFHSPKSVTAPKPPSVFTNVESQDQPDPKFLPTAKPGEKSSSNLPSKPPATDLIRDDTESKSHAHDDIKGKGKAPETEQEEEKEEVAEVAEEASEPAAKPKEELRVKHEIRMVDALIRERFANRTPLPQDFMPKGYAMEEIVMDKATELEICLEEAWLLAFIMEMEDGQRKKYANADDANEETPNEETSNQENANYEDSPPPTPALTNGPSASSRDEDEPINVWDEEWNDHN